MTDTLLQAKIRQILREEGGSISADTLTASNNYLAIASPTDEDTATFQSFLQTNLVSLSALNSTNGKVTKSKVAQNLLDVVDASILSNTVTSNMNDILTLQVDTGTMGDLTSVTPLGADAPTSLSEGLVTITNKVGTDALDPAGLLGNPVTDSASLSLAVNKINTVISTTDYSQILASIKVTVAALSGEALTLRNIALAISEALNASDDTAL